MFNDKTKCIIIDKTKYIIVALLTMFIAISCIFIAPSCTKNEPPVRIGAALTLTGPAIYVGEEVRDGLLLAADEINERDGINGRKIDIIVKNAASTDKSQSDKVAEAAFNELDKADPLAIVSCLSFLSMKLAPMAEAKNRLLVGLVATVPELTQNRQWVYRYWTTAEHEAPPITDIFLEIGGKGNINTGNKVNTNTATKENRETGSNIGNLGVIYLDDAYGGSVFKDMVKRCKDKGIQVVPSPFTPDNKDFSSNVNTVKDTKAVAVIGFDFHIIKTLKALRSIGYKGEIISTTTATLPSVTTIPESNGVHVTAPALYNKNYPFADAVKKRYEEKYKKRFNQYAANGYDFIYILSGLMEDKTMTQETVKKLFDKGFVYSGVFGNIELKKGEKDILFPLFPAQIKNGEIIYR